MLKASGFQGLAFRVLGFQRLRLSMCNLGSRVQEFSRVFFPAPIVGSGNQ